MTYKIKSIKHSGRKEKRGNNRTDGRYPKRIGRIVELDPFELIRGYPLYLYYLKDSDGSDYIGTFLTSFIVDVIQDNNTLIVETNNSIYEFEKVARNDI